LRLHAAAIPAVALLLGLALLARPLFHGIAPATIVGFWTAVLGQALLPGVVLAWGARLVPPGERLLLLGQGATLGLALQGLSLLAGRALGAPWLTTLVALGATGLGLALARRAGAGDRRPGGPAESPGATAATLAIALVAVALLPLASADRPAEPLPFDLLFHGGTAAELRHRWPLEDPRVAGVPLRYHLLAYALPVAAADLAGAPLADTLFALAPLFWLVLLALQLRNAGRALFGDDRAGAIAAAVVLFHADPGRVLGLGAGAFNSFLTTGLYGSPTTLLGFVLVCGVALALHAWLERGDRLQLAALALVAAAASGAKTTVLPVVLPALGLAALHAAWRRREAEVLRLALALAVVALAGAPLTLWQNVGTDSYSAMAGFGFAKAFSSSAFAAAVARTLGDDAVSGVLAWPAFLAWLVGYLGLAGVATAYWLSRRRAGLDGLQAWALGVAAVGLVTSLALDVPGLSQLFLLYNGQLVLGLFAGAGIVAAWHRPSGAREALGLAALVLACVPVVDQLAWALPAAGQRDAAAAAHEPPAVERDYAQGLAWLRANASRDAVVWADNPSLLLSAMGEVRLYYENGLYSARAWRVGAGREPWPERVALQERLLRRPDRTVIEEARRAIGPGPRLLVVADAVQSGIDAGFVRASLAAVPRRRLFPPALFKLRFVNDAMQVYEALE